MYRLTALLLTFSFAIVAHQATAADIPDPAEWYTNDYASLWGGTPAKDADKILDHYADVVVTHETDGKVTTTPQREWLMPGMEEWVAEGWLRAEMTNLETHEINATTASFVATWKDYYESGETEVSCGWYLADFADGEWHITEYADTTCP